MNTEQLEKYSSAMTLSDMEIFVFPELAWSLVLANIMSPVIWKWRDLDWCRKLESKPPYKKLMRLRQFIMDEYEFNLDLETWGLTNKTTEMKRFEKFISSQTIAQSNALFGYEGDKYYFDVEIRKHFGLDKYDTDIIPYWKTETVEAMNAFRLKPGYKTGAGECVSLSTLYAAAAFIICDVPLENIFMILTPLHSQNFIDIQDGILTNNRRLVTKTMWFNGTATSNKAQRALRHENITIVAHPTGYVHCIYDRATIDREAYQHFAKQLGSYLTADLTLEIFANFLRLNSDYQKFFQLCRNCRAQPQFLKAETLFSYEAESPNYRIACKNQEKLLAEASDEDFVPFPVPGRIRCDEFEKLIEKEKPDLKTQQGKDLLIKFFQPVIPDVQKFVDLLADFIHIEPKLPSIDKTFVPEVPIKIPAGASRQQLIDYLQSLRSDNTTADLAFYAYRDMESCDWLPFVKAAVERNPVSVKMTEKFSIDEAYHWLSEMRGDSIYDAKRLAQPDEVANYKTGDGLEKALTLANIICTRNPEQQIKITVDNNDVVLDAKSQYRFRSQKNFKKQIRIADASYKA
jgi:hypothetical protein